MTALPIHDLSMTGRHRSVRATLARQVLKSVARRVPVQFRMPDGTALVGRAETELPTLDIVRPDALFARIAEHPKLGIGEGYMAGEWRAGPDTDLADVLLPFAERMTTAVPPALAKLRRIVDRPLPREERNSRQGSRRNIEAHYDLSNDLFAAFLDETMSYSSALFDSTTTWADQDLREAQQRKIAAILDLADIREGTAVLEIGTGWGALAIAAARRGARVTTVTLSQEQAALAVERIEQAGLQDSIEVRIQDYRDVTGSFDAVVSVEMIEAVGEEFWPTYFSTLDRLLAPGGTVAIQAILMAHDRYLATRNSYGWIQKHIFPGGLIPSLKAIDDVTTQNTDLRIDHVHGFGKHYAETLRRWRRQFNASWPQISRLGFDETFRRKWEFYLAYCEAGFDAGYLDVAQVRFRRPEATA